MSWKAQNEDKHYQLWDCYLKGVALARAFARSTGLVGSEVPTYCLSKTLEAEATAVGILTTV